MDRLYLGIALVVLAIILAILATIIKLNVPEYEAETIERNCKQFQHSGNELTVCVGG